MSRKSVLFRFFLPLLLLGGLLWFFYTPQKNPEEQARYVAIFCHNASRSVDDNALRDAVERSTPDYALARQRVNHQTARQVIGAFNRLNREEKQALRANPALCRERLTALLNE